MLGTNLRTSLASIVAQPSPPHWLHCKDIILKIRSKYSQKGNCAAWVPISTFTCLWVIFIFPRLVCLFCYRKISWEYINQTQTHECGNWDWGQAIPFLGIQHLFRIFSIMSLKCSQWGGEGYGTMLAREVLWIHKWDFRRQWSEKVKNSVWYRKKGNPVFKGTVSWERFQKFWQKVT